jgi:hypothetical protein
MSRVLPLTMHYYADCHVESGPVRPRPAFQCRGDWPDLTGTMMTSPVPVIVCADLKKMCI